MTTGTAVVDLDGVLYAADTFTELAIHRSCGGEPESVGKRAAPMAQCDHRRAGYRSRVAPH
ncbi:hypothetical protein [Saccharopolyspora sp. ASAGF58]|uniref:hypothetical protein n=1 Tax=Saccharopolyspora sp. ASAGF58 TaxID=2719023 RepID=UPI0014401F80|nr:hypothetical protein [Saccharopolyspora sp. ASAGF58]QIZ38147.1 hypothetical protein FDZ84_30735 [Saccharopolyspora sp. ASAGF58]